MGVFKGSDLNSKEIFISAKKMPAVFPEGEDEWKNFIMCGKDGSFYLYKDCGNKKRGQIVPDSEMEKIFKQLAKIELINEFNQKKNLDGLMEDPSKHSILAHKLNQLDKEAIKEFLKKFVILRESDQALVYLNGTVLSNEEAQELLQKFALIPSTLKEKAREEKIEAMIKQIGSNIPKDLFNLFIFKCSDGQFVTRDGKLLSNEEVKLIFAELSKAESCIEMNEDYPKIEINLKPEFEIKFDQIIDDYIHDDLIKNGCISNNDGPEIEIKFKSVKELKNDQEIELQEKQEVQQEVEVEVEVEVQNEPEVEIRSEPKDEVKR
jgi:hypothetical protein